MRPSSLHITRDNLPSSWSPILWGETTCLQLVCVNSIQALRLMHRSLEWAQVYHLKRNTARDPEHAQVNSSLCTVHAQIARVPGSQTTTWRDTRKKLYFWLFPYEEQNQSGKGKNEIKTFNALKLFGFFKMASLTKGTHLSAYAPISSASLANKEDNPHRTECVSVQP